MKILILGATGFLGGVVTRRLAREGHHVVCLARKPSIPITAENIEYIQATLDDTQAISDNLKGTDFLVHFAWDTTPGTSKGQPTVEAINNLLPTFRLIEELQSVDNCKLIFVSSAGAVYDENSVSSACETSPLNPKSYYGAGKLAAEMFLRAYCAQSAHPVVITRPANVYGPGQQAKRQFAIVPTLMRAISSGSTFKIWGNGEAKRDYLYAEDFAEFFIALTNRQWRGVNIFNVASQKSYSVNYLCELLQEVSGRQLSIEYVPDRGVDSSGIEIDCSRAKAELGWHATTELEDGLTKTWEWFIRSK